MKRRIRKIWTQFVLTAAFVWAMLLCVGAMGTEEVSPDMVITAESTELAPNGKLKMQVHVQENFVNNRSVVWRSSNPKYATVSKTGVVTAKAAGRGKTVVITGRMKNNNRLEASYRITILRGGVKRISLSAARKVQAGRSVQVRATVSAARGASKRLYWYTSNTRYATVNQSGLVRTKRAGRGRCVSITARATDGSSKRATISIRLY